eukprot:jgi/Undpi1/1052/HiC_scaffold_10.g04515.m1
MEAMEASMEALEASTEAFMNFHAKNSSAGDRSCAARRNKAGGSMGLVLMRRDTGFLVYQAVKASENPSTSFALSNNVYKYPDIYVCLYSFYGCDTLELEEKCRDSTHSTEGGRSTAIYNPTREDEQILQVDAVFSEEKAWCVSFAASEIVVFGGERDPEDYILLNMYWYPGGSANASNTCINEEGEWESHSESVLVTLRDADTGDYSAGIRVPYSCATSASNSHSFAYMGIGLTKDNKLRSGNTASYKAVTMSSSLEKDKRDASITGITSPYAWLSMEIAQEENSLEDITEIDPLQIAEIFGNVGGFWDLLLLLWPIFFVAATREDPHLKARSFRKSIARGSERVVGLSQPVRMSLSLRRRRDLIAQARQRTTVAGDLRPAWEDTDASSRQQMTHPHSAKLARPVVLFAAFCQLFLLIMVCSKLSLALYDRLGINKIATRSYHQCTNGGVERVNHTLALMLAMVGDEQQTDWDIQLPQVESACNNSVSAAAPDLPPTSSAAIIHQGARKGTDAIVLKTQLSFNWICPFKILAVGTAPASAAPDGRPLHDKLLYVDLSSDMPGRDSKPRISNLRCKPCRNPDDIHDKPKAPSGRPHEIDLLPSFYATSRSVSTGPGTFSVIRPRDWLAVSYAMLTGPAELPLSPLRMSVH